MASQSVPTLGSLLNPVDRLVAWLSPEAGLRRLAHRAAVRELASVNARAHDVSAPSRLRKFHSDRLGPNDIVREGAVAIRAQVRHIFRNNDIARGIGRTMVNNVIGPNGIGVEFTPRRLDGSIHDEYAAALAREWKAFSRRPEVQRRFHMGKCQRMMGWAWLRDGEAFSQDLIGYVPGLTHASGVPYSIELFEADLVPLDYNEGAIMQGVERNAWGQILRYWVYKGHPMETQGGKFMLTRADMKAIDSSRVRHLAFLDHVSQVRGISEFASIIARLEDIRDYEESERIAAKVAASLTAYIKKNGGQDGYDASTAPKDADGKPVAARDLRLSPGMIIDGLAVGEEIGLIDSNRPNPNLITYRQGQLRAAAAGVGVSYSSAAKSYDGTFSSQRQELVEQWVNYAVLADEFTGAWLQPVVETFVAVAHISGVVPIPRDVQPGTHDDVLFTAQAMPWIDPLKEASAWLMLVRAGFASEYEVQRKRGVSARDFLEQVTAFRKAAKARELVFTSDAANEVPVTAPTTGPGTDDVA